MSVFLSLDAGLSWKTISNGSYVFSMGDHGGLIVLARNDIGTKGVTISWNSGLTWKFIPINKNRLRISNIIPERDGRGLVFIIQGHLTSNMEGFVATIDFTHVHPRKCNFSSQLIYSDYEEWISAPNIHKCQNGVKLKYLRRKEGSECFNPLTFNLTKIHSICKCSPSDFECDFGYKKVRKGVCSPYSKRIADKELSPDNCLNYYKVKSGYRKMEGNQCQGGIKNEPKYIACSKHDNRM